MPTLPPQSALDPRTQTFPTLTPDQIERFRQHGSLRHVQRGDILFTPNDTDVPFFVVLSGEIEILQPDLLGEKVIVTHTAGHFTGEITMISGQRCLVLGRVSEPGELIELTGDQLRNLISKDAEISEILLRAFILRRLELINRGYGNVILLGSRHSAETLELREFLSRNGHPYTYIDLDSDRQSQYILDRFHVSASEVPVLICNGQNVLRRPTIQQLANCLGLSSKVEDRHIRDVIVVGAGPAGLAAAVYGASEGLDTLVIETSAPGGQAGSSSKIENYLGFPLGISGQELAARAATQAQKFGATMVIARTVVQLRCDHHPFELELDGGEVLFARSIVIATGAQYNRPPLANLAQFQGKGVYYGATYIESQLCADKEVAVVGGGNSAGQAAVFLSQNTPRVHMIIRSGELRSTMSRYLIQRLTENPNIQLHYNTEVIELQGEDRLERIVWLDKKRDERSTRDIRHLFILAGASPHTDWLRDSIALDGKGFILTGRDLEDLPPAGPCWKLDRRPQMLETSLPGVFAVGDSRSGSVKRVASAVGEGAIAIHMVHQVLAEL